MILPASAENVAKAAEYIREGGVVAFPTETVYGLGADAMNPLAVAEVFEIKARPSFDPLIVHIIPDWWAELVTDIPAAARELAQRYWPGPLTIVLPKTDRVPDIVTAGLPSVAVRVPHHAVAQALITTAGCPIAAPSANPFGYISPTTAAHVDAQIGARVPIILDGGPCTVGVESTIVSFVDPRPALLRPGGVPIEAIEAIVGPLRIATSARQPVAPGQLPRHYAPRTPLTLVRTVADIPLAARGAAALLLPFPSVEISGFARVETLADREDLRQVAANLFAALRRLDTGTYARIYAVGVPERGLGHAIMDRLRRAGNP